MYGILNQRLLQESAIDGVEPLTVPISGPDQSMETHILTKDEIVNAKIDELQDKIMYDAQVNTAPMMEYAAELNSLVDELYIFTESTMTKINAKRLEVITEAGADGEEKGKAFDGKASGALIANIIAKLQQWIRKFKEIFLKARSAFANKIMDFKNWAKTAEPKLLEKIKEPGVLSGYKCTYHVWNQQGVSMGDSSKLLKVVDDLLPLSATNSDEQMESHLNTYKSDSWSMGHFKASVMSQVYGLKNKADSKDLTVVMQTMRDIIKKDARENTTLSISDVNSMIDFLSEKTSVLTDLDKVANNATAPLDAEIRDIGGKKSDTSKTLATYLATRVSLLVAAMQVNELVYSIKRQCVIDEAYEYMKVLSGLLRYKTTQNEGADDFTDFYGAGIQNESASELLAEEKKEEKTYDMKDGFDYKLTESDILNFVSSNNSLGDVNNYGYEPIPKNVKDLQLKPFLLLPTSEYFWISLKNKTIWVDDNDKTKPRDENSFKKYAANFEEFKKKNKA